MDTLLTILKPICQTGMNLSLKKCLVSILQAMIVSWSVNILKLASEFTSRADVSSVVRRIESSTLMRVRDISVLEAYCWAVSSFPLGFFTG